MAICWFLLFLISALKKFVRMGIDCSLKDPWLLLMQKCEMMTAVIPGKSTKEGQI